MRFRKITINIFIAFVVFPFVMRIKYWIDFQINPMEQYNSLYKILIYEFVGKQLYYILSFSFLLLALLPYQLIKDNRLRKGKKDSILHKGLIFTGILCALVVLLGSFSNIWMIPWYKNFLYILFMLFPGFFFAGMLYFLVDKHEERKFIDTSM